VDAIYGTPDEGRSRTPYEAFVVRGRFGGGSSVSDVRVRGQLMAQPFANGKGRFSVLQSYDYQKNDAYGTGSQSSGHRGDDAARRDSDVAARLGRLTVLGAVDSLPLGVEEFPRRPEGGPGQEVCRKARLLTMVRHHLRRHGAIEVGRMLSALSTKAAIVFAGRRPRNHLCSGRLDLVVPLRGLRRRRQ
jgi:hypothetical protein